VSHEPRLPSGVAQLSVVLPKAGPIQIVAATIFRNFEQSLERRDETASAQGIHLVRPSTQRRDGTFHEGLAWGGGNLRRA
jgi:hypothetical protein